MTLTDAALVALSTRERNQVNRIRDTVTQRTQRAWDSLGDYTSPGVEDRWLAVFEPIDAAGISFVTQAVDASFALQTEGPPLVLPVTTTATLRGVETPAEVLRRPLVEVWTALAGGKPWVEAVKAGRSRAAELAQTDATLAQRRVADAYVGEGRAAGYRRTLTGKSCVLCATASTQRYTRGRLMPIHTHCDCGVAPIVGDKDPGQIVNRKLLRELKSTSNEPQYWKDHNVSVDESGRVVNADGDKFQPGVGQHGELGPVLTDPTHNFASVA